MTQEPMLQALNLMGNPEQVPEFINSITTRFSTLFDGRPIPNPGDDDYEAFEKLGDDLIVYTRLLPFRIIENFDMQPTYIEKFMRFVETIDLVDLFLSSYEFCVSGDIDDVEGELKDFILTIPKQVDTPLN